MMYLVEKLKKNKLVSAIVILIIGLFLYINYSRFNQEIASNSKFLINYKQNVDELENYRNPKLAVMLYNGKNLEIIISPSKNYFPYLYKSFGMPKQALILDPITEHDQIAAIASARNLVPQTVELNSKNLDNFFAIYDKNNHKANVANFVDDHKSELIDIIYKSITKSNKHFHPSKKDYSMPIFDRGNSFVFDNFGVEVGSLNSEIGIGQDVASNIFEARKQGLDIQTMRVMLLTYIKPVEYSSQEELYANIKENVNGIVLRDGYRQAVMLPHMWNKYKSKKEFIDALKIKAKLLPNYSSNKIKFYTFEGVEIIFNKPVS